MYLIWRRDINRQRHQKEYIAKSITCTFTVLHSNKIYILTREVLHACTYIKYILLYVTFENIRFNSKFENISVTRQSMFSEKCHWSFEHMLNDDCKKLEFCSSSCKTKWDLSSIINPSVISENPFFVLSCCLIKRHSHNIWYVIFIP